MPAITAEELELAIDTLLALGQPDVVPQVERQQVDAARVFHHFLEENNEDQVAAMHRYVGLMAEGRDEEVAAGDDANRFARAVLAYIPQEMELPWYQRLLLMPLQAVVGGLRDAFRAIIFAARCCCDKLIRC